MNSSNASEKLLQCLQCLLRYSWSSTFFSAIQIKILITIENCSWTSFRHQIFFQEEEEEKVHIEKITLIWAYIVSLVSIYWIIRAEKFIIRTTWHYYLVKIILLCSKMCFKYCLCVSSSILCIYEKNQFRFQCRL